MISQTKRFIREHMEIGILLIGLILVIWFTLSTSGKWANSYNIGSILQVTATLGLMSMGVALVIGTGEIDISVGSTFGMGALIYLWFVHSLNPIISSILAVLAGILIGVFNGILVTKMKTPSLIITLGSLMIFRGLAIAVTNGFSFSVPYSSRDGFFYEVFGGGEVFGFNTAIVWLILGIIVLTLVLLKTPWGNRLLAVGGSAESAHSRGVDVDWIKISAFVASGALAAFAGVLEAGKLGFADGSMGRLMELQAIASCVLGGSLLSGGRISLPGAVVGAFVLSSIQSYLVFMGVRPQWFILLLGLIVVFAALGDKALRQWATKK